MSIKKYVKENIYGLPNHLIGIQEVEDFKTFMLFENPEYLNDMINEIDGFELIKAICMIEPGNAANEISNIEKLFHHKCKKEILTFIDEIREQEEGELDDHGMKPSDFLQGKL